MAKNIFQANKVHFKPLHIRKNTQNGLFCQTTNSDELALGMKRWLEVHLIAWKIFFAKYKYFIIYPQKTQLLTTLIHIRLLYKWI